MTSRSNTEAAKVLGVNRATISRYYKDPEFKRLIEMRKRKVLNSANEILRFSLHDAARLMSKVINDEDEPTQTRLYAAGMLMRSYKELATESDILERFEALEGELEELKDSYNKVIEETRRSATKCITDRGGTK